MNNKKRERIEMRVDDNFGPVLFKDQRDSAPAIFTHISYLTT